MGCGRHGGTEAVTVVSCVCIARKHEPWGDCLNNTMRHPHSLFHPKGLSLELFALFICLLNYHLFLLMGLWRDSHMLLVFPTQPSWFWTVTAFCFLWGKYLLTATFEKDFVRSKYFCWLPPAMVRNHTSLLGLLTDGDMLTKGKYGRFFFLHNNNSWN